MKLDVIVVKDAKTNDYTAFVKQFPGVVVQASNRDDIPGKLDKVWAVYIDMLRKWHFQYNETEVA